MTIILLAVFLAALFLWERAAPRFVARLEENILILLMATMVLVSFGQVVARYMFNTGWAASLEFVTICFSWLILLGAGYGIRESLHLGVDVILRRLPSAPARALAVLGAASGLLYGLILLDAGWLAWIGIDARSGAIEYWDKMYKIGIGAEELRWPVFVQEWFGVQDRVQRWILLLALPFSLALVCLRSAQGMIEIWRGERAAIIASHEGEQPHGGDDGA